MTFSQPSECQRLKMIRPYTVIVVMNTRMMSLLTGRNSRDFAQHISVIP